MQAEDEPGAALTVTGSMGTSASPCSAADPDQRIVFSGDATTGGTLKQQSSGMCISGACDHISGTGCEPLGLVTCDASDPNQLFTSPGGQLVNQGNGGCLDLWGGDGPGVGV